MATIRMVSRGVVVGVLAGVVLSLWGIWRWLGDPSGWIQVVAGLLLSLATVLYWRKTRPADCLVVEPQSWHLNRLSPDHWLIQAEFVARNLNPLFEVTLAQVQPRLHLLSASSIEGIQTQIRLRSRHADLPPRQDNYWQAYIITPQSQTGLEVEIELRGEELADLRSAWLELDYVQYGRQRRTLKTSHLILPLQEVEPLPELAWQQQGPVSWAAIPTHLLTPSDDLAEVLRRYVGPHIQPGDIVAISESAAAIVQGNFRHPLQVQPGWLARTLCYFFPSKTSLSSCYGMQTLIDCSGAWRVLAAFVVGSLAKLLGIPGVFYALAGEQADLIDDVTGTLPPYDQFIVLGPRQPAKLVAELHAQTGYEVAIVDANDLGEVTLLAASPGVERELVEQALRKNPAGNAAEQTPLVLIRKRLPASPGI
ncbi:hypothetical protein [Synechococcus sp. H70.1]|uniref:hypothetical protein n=1 Tax=Synechococcus sp. H70.1 TaxID=2964527 RepID=UPI0039C6F84B